MNNKETLYYKDNYLMDFSTKVVDCIQNNDKYNIVLEETAFYPEGGGQNADTGFIDEFEVIDVQEKDGIIYHTVNREIEIGKEVNCKIDFETRFSNMQHHTAEHIVSGIICDKYNTENVGFHMGSDAITMDFTVVLNKEQIEEVEKIANEAVYKNISVVTKYYTKDEAKDLTYRSKKELDGVIRIVEIPGYDICACCGLHVRTTGEIGLIKLLSVEKYKSGCRISMLCGDRALENYNDLYKQIDDATTLLSAKHNELVDNVKELIDKNKELKHEISVLKNQIFDIEIKNMPNEKNLFIIKENLEPKEINDFCLKLKEKAEDIAGVFVKVNDIYRFQIVSNKTDLVPVSKELMSKYEGRGGGKSNSIQGQLNMTKEQVNEIINWLNKLNN